MHFISILFALALGIVSPVFGVDNTDKVKPVFGVGAASTDKDTPASFTDPLPL